MANKKNDSTIEALLLALSANITDEDLLLSTLQANIAATITEKRASSGMSQKDLADALHVTQGMVSRWESGNCNFTLQTLVKIAQNLSIEMQSPYVLDTIPHYHTVENVTMFPASQGNWVCKSYTSDNGHDKEDLKEM